MLSLPIPLLERSDGEMARRIRRRIQSLEEVADCNEVTVGFTRKKPNIHSHVLLKGNPSFEESHRICSRIDREVRKLVPNARVVIHSEATGTDDTKELWNIVKRTAEGEPGSRGVQNIHLRKVDGKLGLDFHLQVSTLVAGQQADELEARVAQKLKTTDPRITEVVIHQASVSYLIYGEQAGHGAELSAYFEHIAKRFRELVWLGPPTIWKSADGLHLVDRVAFLPGTSHQRATEIASELETAIKNDYPAVARAEIIEEQRGLGGT